jgi:hypothetical protein
METAKRNEYAAVSNTTSANSTTTITTTAGEATSERFAVAVASTDGDAFR